MKGSTLTSGKQQPASKMSEIKLRSNMVSYDLELKLARAQKTLENGETVKISLKLNREEKYRPHSAVTFLFNVIDKLEKYGTPQDTPTIENLMVVLRPKK